MATEDLLINNGCNRQTVEAVSEGLPQLYVVSPLTCGRKAQIRDDNLISRAINSRQPNLLHNIGNTIFSINLALLNSREGHVIVYCTYFLITLFSLKPGVLRACSVTFVNTFSILNTAFSFFKVQ